MGTAIAEAVMTYKEDVMANIADFGGQAVTEAPNPEDRAEKGQNDERGQKSDIPKEKSSKKSRTRASNENVAKGTASKETVQIIEEAGKKSKETSRSSEEKAGEVVVSATAENATTTADKPFNEKNREATEGNAGITYKVQLMASAKDFPLRPESFNGLNRVAKEPIKNLFRYVYGSTQSLREAEMLKSNADMKGYPTSFIVVYRDGERITFKESQKYISGE